MRCLLFPFFLVACANSSLPDTRLEQSDLEALLRYEVVHVEAVLKVANEASFEELDLDVPLDVRAARNIVDARPIADLESLDAVPWVGPDALARLDAYAARSVEVSCPPGMVISDQGQEFPTVRTALHRSPPETPLTLCEGVYDIAGLNLTRVPVRGLGSELTTLIMDDDTWLPRVMSNLAVEWGESDQRTHFIRGGYWSLTDVDLRIRTLHFENSELEAEGGRWSSRVVFVATEGLLTDVDIRGRGLLVDDQWGVVDQSWQRTGIGSDLTLRGGSVTDCYKGLELTDGSGVVHLEGVDFGTGTEDNGYDVYGENGTRIGWWGEDIWAQCGGRGGCALVEPE